MFHNDPLTTVASKQATLTSFSTINLEFLSKCRKQKTCDLDLLPTAIFKQIFPSVSPFLLQLINSSLTSGVVPSIFKKAVVTPLLKKNSDQSSFSSYRPISNLSYTSKCLETAVSMQLFHHLGANRLLNPLQSAYRPGHSTETAMLHVHSSILEQLDKGKSVFLVLLDLSAAFDTISHKLFLDRLKNKFHIDGLALRWFESYLSDRHFKVSVGGSTSGSKYLSVGVPQGSVLGPVLFSLYTSPLRDIFVKHQVTHYFYADDTQFWIPFDSECPESEYTARTKISTLFSEISEWMFSKHLKLNANKTVFLPISRARACLSFDPLLLGGTQVGPSEHARDLGIIISSNGSMDKHISSVVSASFYQLRFLRSIRDRLPAEAFLTAIHAFVTNRLDACNGLYIELPKKLLNKLQNVQNAAAKLVTKKSKYDSATEALNTLHWLPVRKRIIYKTVLLSHKIYYNNCPAYFSEFVKHKVHHRTTRSAFASLLECMSSAPKLKTVGERSFFHQAPKAWNRIPEHLRSIKSLDAFKCALKTFLFSDDF